MINYWIIPGLPPGFKKNCKYIELAKNVCEYFGITFEELVGKRRLREYVIARQAFVHLAFMVYKPTFKQLGRLTNRDHSSIIHSKTTAENALIFDKHFGNSIKELKKILCI